MPVCDWRRLDVEGGEVLREGSAPSPGSSRVIRKQAYSSLWSHCSVRLRWGIQSWEKEHRGRTSWTTRQVKTMIGVLETFTKKTSWLFVLVWLRAGTEEAALALRDLPRQIVETTSTECGREGLTSRSFLGCRWNNERINWNRTGGIHAQKIFVAVLVTDWAKKKRDHGCELWSVNTVIVLHREHVLELLITFWFKLQQTKAGDKLTGKSQTSKSKLRESKEFILEAIVQVTRSLGTKSLDHKSDY